MAANDISIFSSAMLSVVIAAAATISVGVVAIPLAFVAARKKFPGKWLMEGILLLPLVLPPTVVGYLLLLLLGRTGAVGQYLYAWFGYSIIFRFEGAVLAAAIVALPLMYMPARAAFAGVEREVEDAAQTLGASEWQMFFRVSLPTAWRGVMAAVVLSFARALGEFGATLMVYGWQPRHVTLPISIWAYFENGELEKAVPAVVAMSAVSLVLILFYNRSMARQRD